MLVSTEVYPDDDTVCTRCGRHNVSDNRYCGQCGSKLAKNQSANGFGSRPNQSPFAPTQYHGNPSNHQMNSTEKLIDDLIFMRDQLMQAKDRLNQDNIRYSLGGRLFYKWGLDKRINAIFTQIEEIQQNTFVEYYAQQAAYLLRRQQQQYDFESQYADHQFQERLLDEKVQRQFQRAAFLIEMIDTWFEPGGRFAGGDPEMQREIAMEFIQRALERALGSTEAETNNASDLDYLEGNQS